MGSDIQEILSIIARLCLWIIPAYLLAEIIIRVSFLKRISHPKKILIKWCFFLVVVVIISRPFLAVFLPKSTLAFHNDPFKVTSNPQKIIKKLGFLSPVDKSNKPGEELLDYSLLMLLSDYSYHESYLSYLQAIKEGYTKLGKKDKAKKLEDVMMELQRDTLGESYEPYYRESPAKIWEEKVRPLVQAGNIDAAKSAATNDPFSLVQIARSLGTSGNILGAEDLLKDTLLKIADSRYNFSRDYYLEVMVLGYVDLGLYEDAHKTFNQINYEYGFNTDSVMPEVMLILKQRHKLEETLTVFGSNDLFLAHAAIFSKKEGDSAMADQIFTKIVDNTKAKGGFPKRPSGLEDFWSKMVNQWVDVGEYRKALQLIDLIPYYYGHKKEADISRIALLYLEQNQRTEAFSLLGRMQSVPAIVNTLSKAADIDDRFGKDLSDQERRVLENMAKSIIEKHQQWNARFSHMKDGGPDDMLKMIIKDIIK